MHSSKKLNFYRIFEVEKNQNEKDQLKKALNYQ